MGTHVVAAVWGIEDIVVAAMLPTALCFLVLSIF